ncbi:MAG TPA: ABC transporter substrate-binding protein [Candidatus Baltobacteraceae bacterium]|nr:ABC transporter substrate-binding protein [Candidatus Baltobacteraceae bacterium]
MKRAAALLLLALLAGCSSGAVQRQGTQNELVIAEQREPMSLNPALENGQSQTQWGLLLFSFLVKDDDKGNLVGDVAETVPTVKNGGISADGKTITYHLRKGVRFSDGTPLTAEDARWSIDAINNPANNVQSRYGYDRIAKAEAPDPATLVLHLKEPFAPLLTLVEAPQGFPIFPKHVLAKYPDFNHIEFNSKPVGSGPYVVDTWKRGDRVVMHANPYYFGGKPPIEHLTIRFVPDAAAAANMLQAHEAGLYFNAQDYSQYPLLRSIKGYHVYSTPVAGVGAIIFNTQSEQIRDPRVRRALAQAIDVPAVVRKAYRGAVDAASPGTGLFFWAYDKQAYPDLQFDPAAAKRELIDRKLNLQIVIQAGTPGDAIVANTVAQYERAAGVDVTIKQFNISQFVAPAAEGGPVYGGKFDMALYPFVNGSDPDTTDQFACANVPPHGYNKSRLCDGQVDALLTAGRSTFDPAKRKAIYSKLEARLNELLPYALIYQRREIDTADTRLHGISPSIDSLFWNVGTWSYAGS